MGQPEGPVVSRLTDLIAQVKAKDPQMGADLEREFKVLSSRRAFGLNFERHRPEAVELPQRPVRKGDKVRVLPARGANNKGDQRLWMVKKLLTADGVRFAHLESLSLDPETSARSQTRNRRASCIGQVCLELTRVQADVGSLHRRSHVRNIEDRRASQTLPVERHC
jgi:hypothetical protein